MEKDEIRPVRNAVLPQICWGKMDGHTVCIRLDNAEPDKTYRIIFNGTYTAAPDENGLFWFRDAVPGSRYEIDCEAEGSPGAWTPCCNTVKLNFVPPPKGGHGTAGLTGGERSIPHGVISSATIKRGVVRRHGGDK